MLLVYIEPQGPGSTIDIHLKLSEIYLLLQTNNPVLNKIFQLPFPCQLSLNWQGRVSIDYPELKYYLETDVVIQRKRPLTAGS